MKRRATPRAKAKQDRKTAGLGGTTAPRQAAAPRVPYQPRDPKRYNPPIGLIGCGAITDAHLRAYKTAGYNVVALCDLDPARAEARRAAYYPDATVYSDARQVLRRDDIEVVDITTYPTERVPLVRAALQARKHVLSQKPFVKNLDAGEKLVELAARNGVKLAVNQNGRWAPHFSYIRNAIAAGHVGQVVSAHLGVHWDHSWTAGTPFDNIRHLILYDFAIHWFDIVSQFMSERPAKRVFATLTHAPGQKPKPPMLAQVLIEYDGAQASLVFDAAVHYGPLDHTFVVGTQGTIRSSGPTLRQQEVTLTTPKGVASPKLKGVWFPDGFHGTMGELLCAIEENREPSNSAASNLKSLAICFAALRSADTGKAQVPGRVRSVPD